MGANKEEVESVIAQIPEEINLLDDDESEDASDATDKEVVQFHFLSSINCGSASFLTPDEGFSYGYSNPCSSVYFARSPHNKSSTLSQLSAIDTERGSVMPILTFSNSQITGIKKFPQNPYLLLSCESQQHIFELDRVDISVHFSNYSGVRFFLSVPIVFSYHRTHYQFYSHIGFVV